MSLPPPPQGFKLDPLESFNSLGVKITSAFRTPEDQERIRRQGYKPAANSLHLDADALDLVPGDSGLTMGQLYGRARRIASQWPGARVLNERHHIHVQLPGWGGAPGLPAPPEGFEPADAAPDVAPDVAPPSSPLPSAPAAGGGVTMVSGTDPAKVAHLQGAWDGGASVDQIGSLARELGVNVNPADLVRADAWRKKHGKGSRIVAGDLRPTGPAPVSPGATLKPHNPDLAERLGNLAGDAITPIVGERSGAQFGNKVEGLLDWTAVGDVDAYREFGEGQNKAIAEGRYLDAFGNMVGQDTAAVSMLPIVGTVRKGVSALGKAGESLVDRLGRRGAPTAAPVAGEALDAAPGRVVDRIDVNNLPPPPAGFKPAEEPRIGHAQPMGEQATAEGIAAAARGVRPEDVTPIPANAVESLDEFNRIGDPRPLLEAPDEADALEMRTLPNGRNRRGPLDLETAIRAQPWALRDEAGELSAMDVTNKARDFAKDDAFVGRLVGGDHTVSLDEAARWAWEQGYMPDHVERPSVPDFLDALDATRRGTNRHYRLDDAEELERFEQTQAERFRIEEAAQEGSPLADDIGQPISRDDLDANAPPATAYEDLPTVGGRAANIDIAKLETRGDIRRALLNTEVRFGGFDAARRGKMSQAETARLADELGMTADDLLRRRKGQALNAEQALQARRILAQSGDELVRLAQKTQGGSDEDLATFQRALVRHAAIQEQVTGATAEAGRTLAQFKMIARAKEARLRVLKGLIDGYGGRGRIEDVAEAILDLQRDPGRLNSFALAATKPKLKDKLVELWINSLLTGPQTHAVNMVSNAVTQLGQIPEHAAAAVIGTVRRALNRSAVDRVLFSEVGARSIGMVSGVKRGIINGARAFATETPSDYMAKAEQLQQRAISGTKGKLLRIPTRLLMGADEVFKGIARQSAMDGMAVRIANREGLEGDAAKQRSAELAANPTEEMLAEAFDYARYVTFQRPTGSFGQGVMRWKQDMPLLALVVPFVRTPTNLLKYAVERSPLAPLLKEWRADYAAGGAKRDLALARAFVGSGIGASIMLWAGDGKITGGGPADENAVKLMRADGWQPYSVKIGDKWVSYQRLDPYATILGIASDLATKRDKMTPAQQEKGAAILVTAVLKQLESKTWVSGLADLIKAVDDPQRHGQAFIDRLGGSIAVPTGVAQVARLVDPVRRDRKDYEGIPEWLDSIASRIVSRIPYASRSLPAKPGLWGEELRGEGGAGPDFLSPLWVSSNKNDPVAREMLRIGATFSNVSRSVGGVRNSLEQQNEYQRLAGRYTYEDLAVVVGTPEWEGLTDDERLKWVNEIKGDARAAARDELGLGIPPPPAGFAVAQ